MSYTPEIPCTINVVEVHHHIKSPAKDSGSGNRPNEFPIPVDIAIWVVSGIDIRIKVQRGAVPIEQGVRTDEPASASANANGGSDILSCK